MTRFSPPIIASLAFKATSSIFSVFFPDWLPEQRFTLLAEGIAPWCFALTRPEPSKGLLSHTSLARGPGWSGSPLTPLLDYPLPAALTRLIGREKEIRTIKNLLLKPEKRLVTLTGPGGIGKTQLALACARAANDAFRDGACFVPLVSVRDPAQVIPTIAHALGLKEHMGYSIQEVLQAFLREKQLLLLLDNLEQVIDATPELVALLSFCPEITILATSRETLQVPFEQQVPVPALMLPTSLLEIPLEDLAESPALALFLERAQAVKPDFRLTRENAPTLIEICMRLDGLPLALELAAARIRLLAPQELLALLPHSLSVLSGSARDRAPHQQTLRATMQWSYDLLTPKEQLLFRRLSIFTGSFSLASIEGLYRTLAEETDSLFELVASLMNKSLLEERESAPHGKRLFLLQTLREFGLEQLSLTDERTRCEEAHATYFQLYVKQAILSRPLPFYDAPIETLNAEYSNIRAMLITLGQRQDPGAALQVASSLLTYWTICNLYSEGRGLLEQLLASCPLEHASEKMRRVLPMAYNSAGWLAYWQNDLDRASAWVQASLDLLKFQENTHLRGSILRLSALIEMTHPEGDFAQGEKRYDEGIQIHRARGERGVVGFSLLGLVTLRIQLGEITQNRAFSQESLELCQEVDLGWAVGANLHHLGWLAYLEGDFAQASAYSQDALHHLKQANVLLYLDEALMVYAFEQFALGDRAAAHETLNELLTLARKKGDASFTFHSYYGAGRLALLENELEQATTCFEKAISAIGPRWNENRLAWWLPCCLEGMAQIALRQEQPAWATRLLAAAHTRRTSKSCYFALGQEHPIYDETIQHARTMLGEEMFTHAWEEGSQLLPTRVLHAREPVSSSSAPRRGGRPTLSPAATALGLTPREIDTLRLLVQGLSNAQIAEHLVLSTVTINSYLRSIYSKLGVTSRTAAMRYALDHKLL